MLVSLSPRPQADFEFRDLWLRLQAKGKTVAFLFLWAFDVTKRVLEERQSLCNFSLFLL